MKFAKRICTVFCALVMPAAGWAQMEMLSEPVLPEAAENETEYNPDKPFSGELLLDYFRSSVSEEEDESEYEATLEARYRFSEDVFIAGTLIGTTVKGDGTFPNDYGFYFEELYLSAHFGRFGFFGGKFDPAIGVGFGDDDENDFFNVGYFDSYELEERLGVGATYSFEDFAGGEHTLGASMFQLDTSFLARSLISGEPQALREDGGLSNTGGLDSYTIWLTGTNVFGSEETFYNISYRSQKGGLLGEETEFGFVISASKIVELGNGNDLELYTELVSLNNSLEDNVSFDQDALTATVAYYFGDDWFTSLGGGVQKVRNSSDTSEIGDGKNHFTSASIGKSFENGFSAELYFDHDRIDGVSYNAAGVTLYYGVLELSYRRERTDGDYSDAAEISLSYVVEF